MPFSAKTVRRFRRFLLGLACFVTLLAAVVVVENIRGDRAWKAALKTHADRGDPLDVLPPPPPPVPAAQNFFQTPLLARLYYAKSNSAEFTAFKADAPFNTAPTGFPSWTPPGRSLDFAAIAQYLEKDRRKKRLPEIPPADSPARLVLAQLASAEPWLDELRRAAIDRHHALPVRPSPLQMDNIFTADVPSFQFVRIISQILTLHADAALALGDNDTACADTLAGLQLTRGMASSPDTLVETMIATVCAKIAILPVWEGLRTHAWTEAQLAHFQSLLSDLHLFPALQRSLRIERNGFGSTITSSAAQKELRGLRFLPAGWLQQNKTFHADSMSADIAAIGTNTSPSFRAQLAALNSRNSEGGTPWDFPYRGIAYMSKPNLGKVAQNLTHTAALITLANTACALERHRLAHGALPETLSQVVPAYLPAIPLDVINGQPLRYQRAADGRTFSLYSVGLDGDDDHGSPLTDQKRPDSDGDWLWPQSK